METIKRLSLTWLTALWLFSGAIAAEDAQGPQAQASGEAQEPQAQSTGEVPAAQELFPAEQVEQLVAPIALYPDALLAQILMASTYPLDVVQAARWIADNSSLEGEALEAAADKEAWDPSVKSLVFFPDVLAFMNDNLDWTQDLGDAVLAQQDDVTGAVQKLRKEAQDAGNLATTEQQHVETQGDTIVIQPADPEVVYVPSYDPSVVYAQPAPTTTYYPTTYVQPVSSSSSDTLVSFGAGALVGGLLTAAILWDRNDSRIYYGGRGYYGRPGYWNRSNYWKGGWRSPTIDVDRSRTVNTGNINVNRGIVGNDVKKWEHNPERRGGVRYRNKEVNKKFGGDRANTRIDRDAARGRERLAKGDIDLGQGRDLKRPGDRELKRPDTRDIKRPAKGDIKRPDTRDVKRPGKGDANRPATRDVKRPEKRDVKRPETHQVKRPQTRDVKKPAKPAAKRPQRRTAKPSAHKNRSAFKVDRGGRDRAASRRGTKSRSGGGRAAGGHRGGRGGGRRG